MTPAEYEQALNDLDNSCLVTPKSPEQYNAERRAIETAFNTSMQVDNPIAVQVNTGTGTGGTTEPGTVSYV